MPRHRILLITTGGTIGGEVADEDADEMPEHDVDLSDEGEFKRDAEGFLAMLGRTVDYLSHHLELEIAVTPYDGIHSVDSSDIDPTIWKALAKLIYDRFDEFDSFIITHGTNTLGYTCAALSFALENSGKPIILTGSQVPTGLPGTDALTNLENAIRVAVWKWNDETMAIRGVMAVFGSHIITGTRVKKDTEFDYDAFKSFAVGSIGRIGRIININTHNLEKHLAYLKSGTYPTALRQRDLRLVNDFDMNIASITEFPGMDPGIFATLVEHNDIRGFILRALGAGDPATSLQPAFTYLKSKKIPIVVTTQAPNGNSNFQVNEPGRWLRVNRMAIPAYDMSIESQTAKLAWLLAQKNKGELTYERLCTEMVHDLRGEIHVMWEIGV